MTRSPIGGPLEAQAGVSAVEMSMALVVMTLFMGVFGFTMVDSARLTQDIVTTSRLQDVGREALARIGRDIAHSGRIEDEGLGITLPHVFPAGSPDGALQAGFQHDTQALAIQFEQILQLNQEAVAQGLGDLVSGGGVSSVGSIVFGGTQAGGEGGAAPEPYAAPADEALPSGLREIVFRLPGDPDGDGSVFSNEDGQIEWSTELVGYLMVPDDHGTFDLVRRTVASDGSFEDEKICGSVEAVTFDTQETRSVLPKDIVEVHIHLRRRDHRGVMRRHHVATNVLMRNTRS